jgi:ketosteroid isomerase-like protein
MAATPEDLETVPQLFYQAGQHVMHANSTPMLALWSEQDDVTYVDPQGNPYQGHESLVAYWQRAVQVNRQAPGSVSVTAELLMMHSSESMVCTVMAEHIQVRQHDQILRQKAVSTNIYRYEGQQWRMIHRHSGSPSEEQ